MDTELALLRAIVTYVWAKGDCSFASCLCYSNPNEEDALNSQDTISWHHFLKGNDALSFQPHQEVYYCQMSSCKLAQKWSAFLSKHLLSILDQLWHIWNSFIHPKFEGGLGHNNYYHQKL